MKNYYNILDKLKIDLTIKENPYSVNPDSLFRVGARINPKRSFLFISKIIGKHLRINPDTMFAAGKLLGLIYLKEICRKEEYSDVLHDYVTYLNNSDTYKHIENINLEKKTFLCYIRVNIEFFLEGKILFNILLNKETITLFWNEYHKLTNKPKRIR